MGSGAWGDSGAMAMSFLPSVAYLKLPTGSAVREHRSRLLLDGVLDARLERASDQREFAVDDHLGVGDFHRSAGLESTCRAGEGESVTLPGVAPPPQAVAPVRHPLRHAP